MSELTCKLPVGSSDVASRTYVFSQVMSKEMNNRIWILGLGVSPTNEWGTALTKNFPYHVYIELQTRIAKMSENINQQDEKYDNLFSTTSAEFCK